MTSVRSGWHPDTETREHWARARTRGRRHSRGSMVTRWRALTAAAQAVVLGMVLSLLGDSSVLAVC